MTIRWGELLSPCSTANTKTWVMRSKRINHCIPIRYSTLQRLIFSQFIKHRPLEETSAQYTRNTYSRCLYLLLFLNIRIKWTSKDHSRRLRNARLASDELRFPVMLLSDLLMLVLATKTKRAYGTHRKKSGNNGKKTWRMYGWFENQRLLPKSRKMPW